MATVDRESFNLLKMTDSGSDSVPDLTFDLPNNSRHKKKVRLKRKERRSRGGGGAPALGHLPYPWWCSLPPSLPSSSHLLTCAAGLAVVALVVLVVFTSNLHYKLQLLEDQLRTKIVDDDAKSVPESLEAIRSRLAALESNQTNVVDKLAQIHVVVDKLSARLDQVNASIAVERGEDPANLNQDVAELREGVGEVTKQLAVAVNRSASNSDSITRLSRELNTLKLNEIDMKNGRQTSLQTSGNLSILETRMNLLNSTLAVQDHRVDAINSTMLDMGHNLTSRMELDHSDVVALMGKVSQLQDDNLNVSSSLATLSSHCSTELHSLLANITSLQERVVGVEEKQVVGVEGKQVEEEEGERQGEVLAQSRGQDRESQVTSRPPGLADRGIRGKKVGEPRYLGV